MPDKDQLLFQVETTAGLAQVWQQNNQRWLTIDEIEQSRIDIIHSQKLVSLLHQAFLSSLLFIDTPEKVLLAGLGGGAIARYLSSIVPDIKGDAIEIEKPIADIAQRYFDFPKNNWNVVIDDIKQWHGNNYDWIFVDVAEDKLTPAWLIGKGMLLKFKQQLSTRGVLAINLLVTDTQSLREMLVTLRALFDRKTLCLAVPDHKNIVVLAFEDQPPYHSSEQLAGRVKPLAESWGLDFDSLLEQLLKDNPQGSGII